MSNDVQLGSEITGFQVKKDTKKGRAWRFEIPHIGSKLEFQIYFKRRFSDLIGEKKIAKLVSALEETFGSEDFKGEFVIDVVPEVKAVIISNDTYWEDFSSTPDKLAKAIEEACEAIL